MPARDPEHLTATQSWLPVLAFVLVGLNLRPGITSLGPVLPDLQQALGLGTLAVSFLTMLPVACLGIFGPLAPRLAAWAGLSTAVQWLCGLLALGLLLRLGSHVMALFGGTLLLAAAIGMISVLMPAIARRLQPAQIGLMMGLFTMSLCLGAASATGVTAMLSLSLGVHGALAIWAAPALLAALLWLALMPRLPASTQSHRPGFAALLRHPGAWLVTGFMASQSSLAFVTFAWLPVMLQDRGLPPVTAGSIAAGSLLAQAVTALLVPTFAARARAQSLWAIGIMAVTAAGFLLLLLAPLDYAGVGSIVLGLGQGGSFGLALTLITLRTDSAEGAAALSGMVQSIGSLLAALGPFVIGLLRPIDGNWSLVALLLAAMATFAAGLGALAGRAGTIRARSG